jgi:predicted dehydrogenase
MPHSVPTGGGHRKVAQVMNLVIRHHVQDGAPLDTLLDAPWAQSAGITVTDAPLLGHDPVAADLALVLVDADPPTVDGVCAAITEQARLCPTLLLGDTLAGSPPLAELAGVRPGPATPSHEVRVRPEPGVDPRRREPLLVRAALLRPDSVADDVDVLATANLAFTDHPAVTFRPATGVGAILLRPEPGMWSHGDTLRFVRHLATTVAGAGDPADQRVGMIGYGAIGHEHALAVQAVPGLALGAVSDLNPARLEVARSVAPDVRAYRDSADLLGDDEVDLVVVSTPPDTHARWAHAALAAGKHVVLEKPMALSAAECDDVIARADELDRLVVVYQNRRFDPDYRVMRRLVSDGAIGELFHLESFVGGYGHPCNYWHSDATVSGGAIFDWGSHFIDQLLDLMPGEIAHVSATNHKRHWHDVTNADHSRVTVHFADGREAQFIHSDLAAAPKPKWWALGTHGAIRGDWRTEKVVGRTAIGTLAEDVLAPAESPALMSLHSPDGSVTALAVPPAPQFAFHSELADHLLRGLPMTVRAEQSRTVVAVMQAAEQSAAAGSTPVRLP